MRRSRTCALIVMLWPVILLAGEASGEFTAGTRAPIRPRYAAAFETWDQSDARKMAIEVVLSEAPIDIGAAMSELDPHSHVINQSALQEHNYVLLWVRPGNDVSMNATYSGTMTQFIERSGARMNAEMTVNTPDKVAGHLFSPAPLKMMNGDAYSVDLTFSTEVTRLPPGEKLPAGGGEPGRAYKALRAAMSSRSWDGVRRHLTAKNVQSFTGAGRSAKENLDDALQTLAIWLPRKQGTITGGELRAGNADLNVEAELFAGQSALLIIRMVKEGPRWVFDRATKAGLIDK